MLTLLLIEQNLFAVNFYEQYSPLKVIWGTQYSMIITTISSKPSFTTVFPILHSSYFYLFLLYLLNKPTCVYLLMQCIIWAWPNSLSQPINPHVRERGNHFGFRTFWVVVVILRSSFVFIF